MKPVAVFLALTLLVVSGCSKSDEAKTGKGGDSGDGGVQSTPEAVVKALFAELKKKPQDPKAIEALMSKEMLADLSKHGGSGAFIKMFSTLELKEVGKVTTHKSGNYAKVAGKVVAEEGKGPEDQVFPVTKVDGKWYLHDRYGPRESKTAIRAKSDSEGTMQKTSGESKVAPKK